MKMMPRRLKIGGRRREGEAETPVFGRSRRMRPRQSTLQQRAPAPFTHTHTHLSRCPAHLSPPGAGAGAWSSSSCVEMKSRRKKTNQKTSRFSLLCAVFAPNFGAHSPASDPLSDQQKKACSPPPPPTPRRIALLAAALTPLALPRAAPARIETERLLSSQASTSGGVFSGAGFDAGRPRPRVRRAPPPPPPSASDHAVAAQAADLLAALKAGDEAAHAGDYEAAAQAYARGAAEHPDLALADVARTRAALVTFQLGGRDGAVLLALEDVEAVLRGSGEVLAAEAVVLYTLRRRGAEEKFAAATALEPRWGDAAFVDQKSGWPPRMVEAWHAFDELK